MPKDDWDLKMKLSDEDLDKEFAFWKSYRDEFFGFGRDIQKIGSAKQV